MLGKKGDNLKSKAQSWSVDIITAVVVFIVAFFIFQFSLNTNPNAKAKNLKEEASAVIKQVASDEAIIRVVDNNEINESKLAELKNLDYNELKRNLRIEGDFCLYLEDDSGNIVLINNSYKGIGSPNINLSNTPCSQR